MKNVTLAAEGSCVASVGPGGYACILRLGDVTRELVDSEARTTNVRMELTAIIHGLSVLKEPCEVEIITSSQSIQQAMTHDVASWQANDWQDTTGKPVKDQDLWKMLIALVSCHVVKWKWLSGIRREADQIYCAYLLRKAIRERARVNVKTPSEPF